MSGTAEVPRRSWSDRLTEVAEQYRLPGAALGVLRLGAEDRLETAGYGVLNAETGVAVTPDSVFQIGSISKVWTATLAMQLVDEGVLELDRPIAELVPELGWADDPVRSLITARHLLSHGSGIDGDLFRDTGRGSDAVARLVAQVPEQPQVFRPGEAYSYCNIGFAVIGRVIEILTGMTWDDALRERLIMPLGLTRTSSLPEEAILQRAAVGHVDDPADPNGPPRPTRQWMFPRSAGPSGLVNSSVGDLLSFVRLHLGDGECGDVRLLSADSAGVMRERQLTVPAGLTENRFRGLGWNVNVWDGRTVIGHEGAVIGQYAFLSVVPDAGIAVALLTNGPDAAAVWQTLQTEILAAEADLAVPQPAGPLDPAEATGLDLSRYVGRYARTDHEAEVVAADGRLEVKITDNWQTVYGPQSYQLTLLPAVGDSFVYRDHDHTPWSRVLFGRLSDGLEYVYLGERITPRRD